MKVAVLAGGAGSRLAEETSSKPKALVDIGGRPILTHILARYAAYGFNDFVVATGYLGDRIAHYFDTADLPAKWTVDIVDTGADTASGGRIKRLTPAIGNQTFMLTWCDGLSDIHFDRLVAFHRNHGKLATVTVVHPPERFGHLLLDGHRVVDFEEKPTRADEWINGAFFVLEPGVLNYIDGDDISWERGPMQALARDGELMAYRHEGFWQCMDTVHERDLLESLWNGGDAPWRRTKPQISADER